MACTVKPTLIMGKAFVGYGFTEADSHDAHSVSSSYARPGYISRKAHRAPERGQGRYEARGSQGLTRQVGAVTSTLFSRVAAASSCTDKPALSGIWTIIGYCTLSWADHGNSQSSPPGSAAGHLAMGGGS